MCQYDTDSPHPKTSILQKMKLKKGQNSYNTV